MDPHCEGLEKCLKEINPKHFPGVYWGEPWKYDENIGCCVDCWREREFVFKGGGEIDGN